MRLGPQHLGSEILCITAFTWEHPADIPEAGSEQSEAAVVEVALSHCRSSLGKAFPERHLLVTAGITESTVTRLGLLTKGAFCVPARTTQVGPRMLHMLLPVDKGQ